MNIKIRLKILIRASKSRIKIFIRIKYDQCCQDKPGHRQVPVSWFRSMMMLSQKNEFDEKMRSTRKTTGFLPGNFSDKPTDQKDTGPGKKPLNHIGAVKTAIFFT